MSLVMPVPIRAIGSIDGSISRNNRNIKITWSLYI